MKSLFENPCRAVKVYYPIGQIKSVFPPLERTDQEVVVQSLR